MDGAQRLEFGCVIQPQRTFAFASDLGQPWTHINKARVVTLAESGSVTKLLKEVTALRQQVAGMNAAVAQREHVFSHAPVGLCYFDLDLRYLHINEWLARINGLSVQEHLGHRIQDLLPNVASGVVPQLRHVIDTGTPVIEGTALVETAAHVGEKRLYEHSYYPRTLTDGLIVGVSCVVRDITERQRAYEKYRRLFDSAINMIHFIDSDARIIDVNETELQKLGYSRKELIGMSIAEIIHPEFREATAQSVATVLTGETVDSYETAFVSKGGEMIKVLANVVPHMVDGEFISAQAITHDITE